MKATDHMKTDPEQDALTEDTQEPSPVTEASGAAAEEFSPKQLQVLIALAQGDSATAAAEAAGINRCTVHRWLKDPAFKMERNQLVQERADQLDAKRVSLGDLALEKLIELLNDQYENNRVAAVKLACKIAGLEPTKKGE